MKVQGLGRWVRRGKTKKGRTKSGELPTLLLEAQFPAGSSERQRLHNKSSIL